MNTRGKYYQSYNVRERTVLRPKHCLLLFFCSLSCGEASWSIPCWGGGVYISTPGANSGIYGIHWIDDIYEADRLIERHRSIPCFSNEKQIFCLSHSELLTIVNQPRHQNIDYDTSSDLEMTAFDLLTVEFSSVIVDDQVKYAVVVIGCIRKWNKCLLPIRRMNQRRKNYVFRLEKCSPHKLFLGGSLQNYSYLVKHLNFNLIRSHDTLGSWLSLAFDLILQPSILTRDSVHLRMR